MTTEDYHLSDHHTHVLNRLHPDRKQQIIHLSVMKGVKEEDLATIHDIPVEVVSAILAQKQK